jgi:prolyl oligopeptidase
MTHRRPPYPAAPKADVVDTYHGVRVEDPYRWLEDPDDPRTIAWVEAQNSLTRSMLDGPVRDALVQRLAALYDFPRAGVPFKRANRYFFTRNSGLQKQPVLFVQDGPGGEPRVLFDPNALDPDGTTALTAAAVNDPGTLMAYGLSKGGSDLQELAVLEVDSGRELSDRIQWVKFASIAWARDSAGFYYTRFPRPGSVPSGDENYFNQVYYHRLGDPQERDVLIFDAPDRRETVFGVDVTDDDRWAVITAFNGSSDKSEVFLLDRQAPHARPAPLFTGFTSAYHFIDEAGGRLFFQTDNGAPLGRIVAVDPASSAAATALEIVPETTDKLSSATIVNDRLITSYLRNASDRIRMFDLAGAALGEIPLPGIGSITGITGRPVDRELFLGFMSFTHPPASYRYEFASDTTTPFAEAPSPVDPSEYETTQVWYASKDGTRVSMFLVHRKDLHKDGQRPVLMTGYGGFNISLTPGFDPSNFAWLDKGGIYAVTNLRGGGEYGEAWHEAGMFGRKQNVFDDFIAAAEWLAASGYTRPGKIAIEGGSNGGLLTGAVMVQRPDLFGAVVCRVPVSDMLRYHLFTVGRFWISEYGSADDPEQFAYLHAYSPLHNVKDGVAYPPILITTADTDDRVSPGMAKKFAARLQEADGDDSPVLIRVETRAGHGAGKPVSKVIEEDADIFAFLFKYLEVE